MKVHEDSHVEERRIRVLVEWPDVQEALFTMVGKRLGLSLSEAKQLDIRIEQEVEGSPQYGVSRWRAEVKGAIDLRPVAVAENCASN